MKEGSRQSVNFVDGYVFETNDKIEFDIVFLIKLSVICSVLLLIVYFGGLYKIKNLKENNASLVADANEAKVAVEQKLVSVGMSKMDYMKKQELIEKNNQYVSIYHQTTSKFLSKNNFLNFYSAISEVAGKLKIRIIHASVNKSNYAKIEGEGLTLKDMRVFVEQLKEHLHLSKYNLDKIEISESNNIGVFKIESQL